MKKGLIVLVAILMLIAYILLFGGKTEYVSMNLKETLESEQIELVNNDYEENDNQVTLIMFRGDGCSHCQDMLYYLSDLTETYGDKFKLRSYEVWGNENNQVLKNKVIKAMNIEAPGVPLLIIGESSFYGFSEDDKEKIVQAIDFEYSQENKYNIIEKVGSSSNNSALYILIPAAIICLFVEIYSTVKKKTIKN